MNIEYIRSDRKTMAIEITPSGRILVRLPIKCSEERAQRFVREHLDWIEQHYPKALSRGEKYNIDAAQKERLRQKAKQVIPERVEFFSRLTGLRPTAVHITSAKTRFGSCSGKNSLNFSLYLMLYSEGAIDYVVLHELAHIKYKNHSREFYSYIEKYMQNYRDYIKELKN